jgi:Skp family chaperone for outer membrane proteins
VDNLVQTAEVGIVNMEGFLAQYQQLQSAFQQLDQLLTQAAAAKIVEIAQQVAREKGFDLVLRKKDVLIYYDSSTVADISGEVEGRLWNLF